MRYQFVDCRWELGNPSRGRELYLAGHVARAVQLAAAARLTELPAAVDELVPHERRR